MTNPAPQPVTPDAAADEAPATAPGASAGSGGRLEQLMQDLHRRFNLLTLTRIGAVALIVAL